MALRQRHHQPARGSVNLALRPQWFRYWEPQAAILDLPPQMASVENLRIRAGTT